MSITAEQANRRLNTIDTIEKLTELINDLDVSGTDGTTMLFSGANTRDIAQSLSLVAPGDGLRIIGDTEAAEFLQNNDLLNDKLVQLLGSDPTVKGSTAYQYLNGTADYIDGEPVSNTRQANGAWDNVSRRFVEEATGEVRVLIINGSSDGVLAQTEIPALINNPQITRVEGIPIDEFRNLNDHNAVFPHLCIISQMNVRLSSLEFIDNGASFSVLPGDYLSNELLETDTYIKNNPGKHQIALDFFNSLDGAEFDILRSQLGGLVASAESLASRYDLYKHANRLGIFGAIIGLTVVAYQAMEAETEEERSTILEQWAVDTAGSEIGAISGAAIGAAVIAAVGIVSAPVTAVLVFGASVVGGLFGSDVANEFYEWFGDLDEDQKSNIVHRLGELFFGENEDPIDGLPTDVNGGLFLFDSITGFSEEVRDFIVNQARSNIAWRYALRELNPFGIDDAEYNQHNVDQSLNLHNHATDDGVMTETWLENRANFLIFERLYRESGETDGEFNTLLDMPYILPGDIHYVDRLDGRNYELNIDRLDLGLVDRREIIFDGDQSSTLSGQDNDDYISGGGGADIIYGNDGQDILEGNNGSDVMQGGEGDDALYGGANVDFLQGGEDRDLLVGGLGEDILEGGNGVDVLTGDIGWIDSNRGIVELRDDGNRDTLQGGEGDDLYFAGVGDIINDSDGRGNVCVSMTLKDGSQQYVQLGLYNIRGTSDPSIYIEHNAYHDLDIEYRLEGDGTLVINGDVRIENFQDTQLGIALDFPSGTSLRYDSYWWNWFADGQYGWVHNTVDQYYASYDVPWAFPARAFVDSRLETERLLALSWELVLGDDATIVHGTDRDDPIHGHEWDDNIQGGEGDDTIDGGAGNDWLNGNEGSDQLNGGEGADQLFGGAGNDTLDGGAGGDRLLGGEGDDILYASDGDVLRGDRGSDRYLYAPGAGDVWIENYDFDPASEDVLQFLAGIQPSDVTLSREIDDLVLTIQGDNAGSVTIRHYFANFEESENAFTAIEFSDGTRWDRAWISNWLDETGGGNDAITGSNEADVLEGYAGDDQLRGSAGDDTLLGGDGNDRLYGDEGNDRLESGNGYDLVHGGQGDDHLIGGTQQGFDELHGEEGNDTIECGLGLCTGGVGDDTYIHTAGQGRIVISNADTDGTGFDQLRLQGISSADVSILRRSTVSGFSGIHQDVLELRYQIDGVYEHIIISGYFEQDGNGGQTIDQIVFDDGTSWDFDYVNNSVRQATDDYDELFASVEGDTLNGLAGDDNLYGNDGDDQLYGDAGDDFMEGGDGDDLLHGGSGNDRMGGGLGSDLYLYNIGDGHDLIYADATGRSSESQNDINRIRLGEGLDRDNVRFIPINQDRYRGSQNGYSDLPGEHLRIEIIETGESLIVQNYFSEYRDPDNSHSYPYLIEFHDGSSISREEIIALCTDVTAGTDYYLGANSADSIHLLQGDDYANGGEGDDQLFGDEGDDWLYGAEGHDELDGGQGNDRLEGREGNDHLNGGAGDDTLYAAQGDDELIGGE
ncbi:MAG: hypothetical protein JAY84_03520, partial [Candidatus Thiodiazotropha taylori]|nr:hypothetical protein [Candidatus Thiodiazotropha taylori]